MTDRPIIFSGSMVQALLDGRKSQTRRILKPQPEDTRAKGKRIIKVADYSTGSPKQGQAYYWKENGCWNSSESFKIPFAVGDRLYVREAFAFVGTCDPQWLLHRVSYKDCCDQHGFDKPYPPESEVTWKPSIHMPRTASRLTLIVTDVRVERAQDISEVDAIREGVTLIEESGECPVKAFQHLWDSLNGERDGASWADNPWVAAVSFDVRKGNIDV